MSQHLVVIKSGTKSDIILQEQQQPHRSGEYPDDDSEYGTVYVKTKQKYAKVICDARPLDKRFYAAVVEEFEELYRQYKQKMEAKPEYNSHPTISVADGYEYVSYRELLKPEADELAIKLADILTDPTNTTSEKLSWRHMIDE